MMSLNRVNKEMIGTYLLGSFRSHFSLHSLFLKNERRFMWSHCCPYVCPPAQFFHLCVVWWEGCFAVCRTWELWQGGRKVTQCNPCTPCSPYFTYWTRPNLLRCLLRTAGELDSLTVKVLPLCYLPPSRQNLWWTKWRMKDEGWSLFTELAHSGSEWPLCSICCYVMVESSYLSALCTT
jgi:hypothetical protein